MPIVRKLEDLERFIVNLMDSGRYKDNEIGIKSLRYEISKEFGISDYVIKSIHGKLIEFGLVLDQGYGRFKMKSPQALQKDVKQEATEEVDELLNKFE